MQANCPSCGNRIAVDDAKVPDRPFQVKCPKCQSMVRFPGKAAAEAVTPPPPAAEPAAPTTGAEEMRAQMMAQIRREMSSGPDTSGDRALVALPEKGQAGAMTLVLTRLGYQVDTLDDPAEGGRLLEQGVYDVVVTARIAGSAMRESLFQRIGRMGGEARRTVFLVLVGDEFKTGDGTQAWACQADLVISSREAGASDATLRNTLAERNRIYQAFNEARKRFETAGG